MKFISVKVFRRSVPFIFHKKFRCLTLANKTAKKTTSFDVAFKKKYERLWCCSCIFLKIERFPIGNAFRSD